MKKPQAKNPIPLDAGQREAGNALDRGESEETFLDTPEDPAFGTDPSPFTSPELRDAKYGSESHPPEPEK